MKNNPLTWNGGFLYVVMNFHELGCSIQSVLTNAACSIGPDSLEARSQGFSSSGVQKASLNPKPH
jgi:hypothetical protein